MDRLTTRLQNGIPVMAWEHENKYSTDQWIDMLEERVAAYEDTHMTPSDIMSMRMDMAILTALFSGIEVDRVRELIAADKAGRVVILPSPRRRLIWGSAEHDVLLCPACGHDLMGGFPQGEGSQEMVNCPHCGEYIDGSVEPEEGT